MDTSTFAQKIKAKYPAYQNVDDATLVNKFIEKYPVYKSQVNIQTDTGADISQTGSAIVNTVNKGVDKYAEIQARQDAGTQGGLRTKLQQLGVGAGTASGVIGDVLTGAIKTVLPQSGENLVKQGLSEGMKGLADLTNRYDEIKNTNPTLAFGINTALGFTPDAALTVKDLMSGYEKLKTTNPALAQDIDSALGFVQLGLDVAGAGIGAKGAKVAGKAGMEAVQTGANKVVGELATGIDNVAGSIVPKPEDIMNRVARLTPTDARKFEAAAGKSHGQYLKETGNFGTPDEIVKKEAEKFVQSINEADNALASLPGEYKSPSIDIAAAELVDKAKRVSAPGIDSPILARSIELQNKANTTGLTMSEVNELKRMYERNVKLGYNKLMNADAVERATNIDNALRNWQFKQAKELGFTNLDELNKQTQLSKFMVDKLGNQILGKSGNNAVGLTDWIMVSGGDPTAIGGLLVKKFFSSEKVQSKIAQMLTKEAPQAVKTATINKPSTSIGLGSGEVTLSKPSQQLLEGKQLKKASTTVSRKNGIKSSDLSTEAKKYKSADDFVEFNKETSGLFNEKVLPGYEHKYSTYRLKDFLGELAPKQYKDIGDINLSLVEPNNNKYGIGGKFPSYTNAAFIIPKNGDIPFIVINKELKGLQLKNAIIEEVEHALTYRKNPEFVKTAAFTKGDDYLTNKAEVAAKVNSEKRLKDIEKNIQSQLTDIWNKANKK